MTTYRMNLNISDGQMELIRDAIKLQLIGINERIEKGELSDRSYEKRASEELLKELCISKLHQASGFF